jgi:hypothetical protein
LDVASDGLSEVVGHRDGSLGSSDGSSVFG